MVETQVANMPRVNAAAGRHGGPTVASYHCSQMPFISVIGTLYMELAWLAALRGRRGIPELPGAWFDGPRVTYVVGDAGEPIGVGPPGAGLEPTVMGRLASEGAHQRRRAGRLRK